MSTLTPIEALERAIAFVGTTPRKPGAVVSRLSQETREALQRLTSDDVADVRVDGLL